MPARDPLPLRLCLGLIRIFGYLVPRRSRPDWRAEWEAEFRHHQADAAVTGQASWRRDADLVHRALGALPDAAWIRRQLTTDAEVVHDIRPEPLGKVPHVEGNAEHVRRPPGVP